MTKVLVLYYSVFGYVAVVASAIAEGARAAGAEVDIRRVPDIASAGTAVEGGYFHAVQEVPVATVEDLGNYDAIVVGSPTRFGRLSAPVAAFLEQVTSVTNLDILKGKVGGAFVSPTSSSGGHEAASMSILTNLLYCGMVLVGPPYSAATLADASGQRHPSALDLEGARAHGWLIAQTAEKLWGQGDSGTAALEWSSTPEGAST